MQPRRTGYLTEALVQDTVDEVVGVPAVAADTDAVTTVLVMAEVLAPVVVLVPAQIGKKSIESGVLNSWSGSTSKGVHMVVRILVMILITIVLISLPAVSSAQPWRHGMHDKYERPPYGQFCPGLRGDPYGARRLVRTTDEAKQVLEQYFEGTGRKVGIGNIEERRWFFIAELLNPEGVLIDKAIVDKRTGRIRSIY
ncbi:MAG: hypothetical protein H6Q54_1687 [Deltaproteobacteria bacterium]|nr:hypothetical protein [Deltaproteobacteria bacterium]